MDGEAAVTAAATTALHGPTSDPAASRLSVNAEDGAIPMESSGAPPVLTVESVADAPKLAEPERHEGTRVEEIGNTKGELDQAEKEHGGKPKASGDEQRDGADDVDMDGDTGKTEPMAIDVVTAVTGSQDDDGDDAMGGPSEPKPRVKADKTGVARFYDALSQLFNADADETTEQQQGKAIAAAFFSTAYSDMVKKGATAKANSALPETTDQQQLQLLQLMKTMIADKRSSMQRVNAAISDLVLACFRSKWTFDQLLHDRIAKAKVPSVSASTAWGRPASTTPSKTIEERLEEDMAPFRFDGSVYAAEEISRLRALCMAPHGFAETPRKGTEDEWKIIWGIMNGSILMRVLPQFLKRCCTMKQFQWLHHYMVVTAEGELYATLPKNSQVYDANQTSKRLCENIRASIVHQNWSDQRIEALLDKIKVVSYNKERHALHFHFFTKKEAIQWENMAIPFRNSKLELKNPDERYREVTINSDGAEVISFKPPTDGARDDRYQTPYKFRLTNITRTTEIDKIAQYLQQITGNGLRIGVPVDPYGQGSDWSLVWEFFGVKGNCPPALVNVNRILWREHEILVIHRAGAANAPCHKCARVGHQEAECPTAEAEWLSECTLIVTEPDIAKICTERSIWTAQDDAKAIFDRLGEEDATPVAQPTVGQSTEPVPPASAVVATVEAASVPTPVHLQSPVEQVKSAWMTVMAGKSRAKPATQKSERTEEMTKTTKKKTKSKPRGRRVASKAASAKTPVVSVTKYEELGDSSDDSDYEDDKAGTPDKATNAPGSISTEQHESDRATPPTPPAEAKAPRATAQEAIDEAIARSNMEKIGIAIMQLARKNKKELKADEIAAALAAKRPDLGQKASRAWILEALSGQIAATLATGNCQFYAVVESLMQTAMKGTPDESVSTELTMLLKFGLRLAHSVNVRNEMPISSIAAIADSQRASEPEAITAYYEELAVSSSERGSILPPGLWGCTETLRMTAKLLNRRIDVVMDTTDPNAVCVMQLQPQRIRDRRTKELFESAVIQQPGTDVWLQQIQSDLERNVIPIIVHYSPTKQHYNAVLLHREVPPAPTKRQTDLRELIQKTESIDEIINTAKIAKQDERTRTNGQDEGPSRLELLASQSEISTNTAMASLTQTNWTHTEKKIVIDCLVKDPAAMKAMLTFWGDGSQHAGTMSGLTQTSTGSAESRVETDGSYQPSTEAGDESDGSSTDEDDEDDAPYAFPSPATSSEFTAWTRAKWQEVRTEWKEQDGTTLPQITDQAALQAFAAQNPEEMAAAGQLFANPFRFLDHFTDDGISAWMSHRWLRQGIKAVGERLEHITAPEDRAEIREWLDTLHNAPTTAVKLRWWKTRKVWRILRAALPDSFMGPTAVPFLCANMTMEAAFVLAIDTLLPSLAQDLQSSPTSDIMAGSSLGEIYMQTPEFQAAMRQAIDQIDWAPVETYLRGLTIKATGPTAATRC